MKKSNKKIDEKGLYLYELHLSNGKFYVGITNEPESRFAKHRSGNSSPFINKNLPIIEIKKTLLKTTNRERALKLETEKTIELIQKYGIKNVYGGEIVGDYHDRIAKFKLYFNRMNHNFIKAPKSNENFTSIYDEYF